MLDYKKTSEELKTYRLNLEEDPSSISLNNQNKKVAICKGYLNRVCSMLLEARVNVRDEEILLNESLKNYKFESHKKLQEDRIKILKTIGQQTAAIELELRQMIEAKMKAENEYNRAVDYYNDVRDVYANLISTLKAIRDQSHIIDQQITIGELHHRDTTFTEKKVRIKVDGKISANQISESITNSALGGGDEGF